MRVLSKADVLKRKNSVMGEIREGAVFIYPTDTIYGIGCVASLSGSVRRVRDIKARESKPFSIIAPSLDWINENCVVSVAAKKWLFKLPGPYTLILPLKGSPVCASANMGLNTIGVRIPDHWISDLVHDLDEPVITTSVNVSGESHAATLMDLMRFPVDFVIYEGPLGGKPSAVVDLVKEEKILRP